MTAWLLAQEDVTRKYLIVVEHDEDTMWEWGRLADWCRAEQGVFGAVVAAGTA